MSRARTSRTRAGAPTAEIVADGGAYSVTSGVDSAGLPVVTLALQPLTTRARTTGASMLGPRPLLALLSALDVAARAAFGDRWTSYTTAAPGPRDDLYVPGEPWRRGNWIGPVAPMTPRRRRRTAR